jgi:site-specific DNA-methyltransferase (adenine-specific)
MNKVIQGDCLEKLKELEDNSVDSIVTDPPYHLVSIVKRFGKEGSAPAKEGKDGSFKRLSGGFMGKTWDGVDENGKGIAYNVDMWKECLRVLKPGGHLLAFGGTRTYHRMAVAIEDAGFEVRDMIEWVYSTGFPKSHNIGKSVDKLQGNEREWVGKNPAWRKGNGEGATTSTGWAKPQRPDITKGTSEWEGWGTALKPAHEPICMARKPLSEKTVASNVLKYGTGGINIDDSRVEGQVPVRSDFGKESNSIFGINSRHPDGFREGRFPANLILTFAENEYIIKDEITNEQKQNALKWIYENA